MQVDRNKQDTSCRGTRGTAKMGTAHLTSERHRGRKSRDTSSERESGDHIQKDSHGGGGGEAASPKVTHTYYTHIHGVSVPTSWFLSHHRTSRGGAENSSHVYHLSMNAPQTFLSPPLTCTFVPGWNSTGDDDNGTGLWMFLQQLAASRSEQMFTLFALWLAAIFMNKLVALHLCWYKRQSNAQRSNIPDIFIDFFSTLHAKQTMLNAELR